MPPTDKTIPETVLEGMWQLWHQSGRPLSMQMVSNSMYPLIREGDHLVIEPQPRQFYLGDVVIYRRHQQLIAHRLIAIRQSEQAKWFILKGDNAIGIDPPLSRKQLMGRVVRVERALGKADYTTRRWRILNRLAVGFSRLAGNYYRFARTLKRVMGRL